METAKLIDPLRSQLAQLEAHLERLRVQAESTRAEVATTLVAKLEAVLDAVRDHAHAATDLWRLRGDALVEQNRKAADATRARVESLVATLRAETEKLRTRVAAPKVEIVADGGPQG